MEHCPNKYHSYFGYTEYELISLKRVRLDKDWIVPTQWSWITEPPLVGQAPSWVCMMNQPHNLTMCNEVGRSSLVMECQCVLYPQLTTTSWSQLIDHTTKLLQRGFLCTEKKSGAKTYPGAVLENGATLEGGAIFSLIIMPNLPKKVENDSKNVLQFLLISAYGRIPCNSVSKYCVHLAVHQGAGGMLVMCSRAEQLGHSLSYILHRNV